MAIEQFREYAPEVIDSFKELVATGCVEILAETYSHSLASLVDEGEFKKQVKQHIALLVAGNPWRWLTSKLPFQVCRIQQRQSDGCNP
jgi:hypothetical protein